MHAERANRIAFALRDALAAAKVTASGPTTGGRRPPRDRPHQPGRDGGGRDARGLARRPERSQAPLRAVLEGPDKPEGLVLNLNDRARAVPRRPRVEARGGAGPREGDVARPGLPRLADLFLPDERRGRRDARPAGASRRCPASAACGCSTSTAAAASSRCRSPLRGHQVTAVEESRKSVKDAELNRRLNGVAEERLKLVCSAVEQALPHYKPGAFDAVILDPPREGCPPEVVQGRLRTAPAGARDPRLLQPRGARARAAARRGGGLPRAARAAGGHVPAHAARRGGGGAGAAAAEARAPSRHVHRLHVHELPDPERPQLPAVAGLPDPAERQARVRAHESVDEAGPGLELVARDPLAAREVAREDGGAEAEDACGWRGGSRPSRPSPRPPPRPGRTAPRRRPACRA